MTATHTPTRHKTSQRPARRRRLPRLGWGWAGIAAAVLGAAKTWPIWTATLLVLLFGGLILRAIRPQRLAPLWHALDRIAERRRALPAGHVTLDTFLAMGHRQFEHAITELAARHPHVHTATRVGGANDRGADVLVHLNDGRRILIQCKHHKRGNNVGSAVVQTINGVYRDVHHCQQAVIVTTADYTRDAIATNTLLPTPIRLINGHHLVHWANGGLPPWQ